MDKNKLFDLMMKFEDQSCTYEEAIELFQELVDNGMAWQLQGFYGRTAKMLIDSGEINAK